MKIAFIGTHGTGKTTLTYELAGVLQKNGYSVDVIKEVAREVKRRWGLPVNEGTTLEAQAMILFTQMQEEIICGEDIKANPGKSALICDRSVIDNYMYMENALGKIPTYENLVKGWLKTHPYDYLFKAPIVGKIEPDGFRSTKKKFQLAIDQRLDEYLETSDVTCYALPAENQSSWLPLVLEKIAPDLKV
jgi:nicotinamide riboside kinase